MIARLLPLILVIVGLAAGAGAGMVLRPAALPKGAAPASVGAGTEGEAGADGAQPAGGQPSASGQADAAAADGKTPARDYVKMNNQFVVPVVEGGRVVALVILSLSLEVAAGQSESVYRLEPKLRDGLLQVMFDHANSGGFRGTFTDGSNMILLRRALLEVAQRVMGSAVSDVLIVDIVRQDS